MAQCDSLASSPRRALVPRTRVRTTHFDTAEEFLSALSRRGPDWADAPNNWLYRGQADSRWKLLPSAFRPSAWYSDGARGPLEDPIEQAARELELLERFANIANEHGLYLPEEVHAAFRWLREHRLYGIRGHLNRAHPWLTDWPPPELERLMALAQHNDVHTRLLDWTYRPLHAAFFATQEAAEWAAGERRPRAAGPRRLAVWALHRGLVGTLPFKRGGSSVVELNPPTWGNANMIAQHGCFTLVRRLPADLYSRNGHALDEYYGVLIAEMEASLFEKRKFKVEECVLRRLTLPVAQAPKLLRLLEEEFVTSATAFPGYRGVARAVLEQRLWDLKRDH
jgi:hypothetical protein